MTKKFMVLFTNRNYNTQLHKMTDRPTDRQTDRPGKNGIIE